MPSHNDKIYSEDGKMHEVRSSSDSYLNHSIEKNMPHSSQDTDKAIKTESIDKVVQTIDQVETRQNQKNPDKKNQINIEGADRQLSNSFSNLDTLDDTNLKDSRYMSDDEESVRERISLIGNEHKFPSIFSKRKWLTELGVKCCRNRLPILLSTIMLTVLIFSILISAHKTSESLLSNSKPVPYTASPTTKSPMSHSVLPNSKLRSLY